MKNSTGKNKFRLQLSSLLILLSFALSFLPPSAMAQQAEPAKTRQLVADESPVNLKRLALVIGNAKYERVTPLKNAANDATDIAATLKKLDFDVIEGVDQTRQQMRVLIREFGEKLNKQGGVGLFFYAGHGVQYHGDNFLIPVDADIPVENEIEDQAINIKLLMAKLDTAKNPLNIILLDACRNNPFAKAWSEFRDVSDDNGLAKIAAPRGTIIFYATEPGKVASDGTGKNGLFTEVLLEQIKKPDVELDAMIKAVKRNVMEKSRNLQFPYAEGTNYRDFYFAESSAAKPAAPAQIVKANDTASVSVVKSNEPAPVVKAKDTETLPAVKSKDAEIVPADRSNETASPPVVKSNETVSPPLVKPGNVEPNVSERISKMSEQDAWNAIKDGKSYKDFGTFINTFPNSVNAAQAKILREQFYWDAIKETRDKTVVQRFLKEFRSGANGKFARIRLQQLESGEPTGGGVPVAETAPPTPKIVKLKIPATTIEKGKTVKTESEIEIEVYTNSLGMELISVPAGSFTMGLNARDKAETLQLSQKEYGKLPADTYDVETPPRRVTIGAGLLIGKTEVTQAQYKAVMDENPSFAKNCSDCPVETVSWEDAKVFVQILNEKNDGFEYRLPTEAEWEYAARGGTTGIFPGKLSEMAWGYDDVEINKTHPVATKQPNAFGIYDMNGNVQEWCEDIFSPSYEGLPVDGSANTSIGDKNFRVLRGGSYSSRSTNMRSTSRTKAAAATTNWGTGFRVVARRK